jgi:hypothetical protein
MYPWSNGDTIEGAKKDSSSVSLTCKNHPDLRWNTKNIMYIGARSIFFFGRYKEGEIACETWEDGSYVRECECPFGDLVIAPESRA